MATINVADLGVDYWCTSQDVRDEFQLEISNTTPDHEKRIEQATRRVRAWYQEAAGESPPDPPPDMLRDATALMAASLAHQAYASNIQDGNEGDQRDVFLERSARDTFDDWKLTSDLDPGAEASGEAGENVTGHVGTINGDNPIFRG